MRVAIVGSRNFSQPERVREFIIDLGPGVEIVSGGARGVDTWAEEAARECRLTVKVFPADWSKGKGAGFTRNHDIVNYADVVVAFWDGQSRGTAHTIQIAREACKWVEVIKNETT